MTVICNNCGADMPDAGYRACETCRAEWRRYGRKPGGPAEQKEALVSLLATTKDVTRILEAVRFTAGLGRGQIERLEKAKAVIAKTEGMIQ